MQIDNQWHTVLEFIVHRLVVPCSHADKSANAAAQNRKREQRGLGDAPLGTPAFHLSMPYTKKVAMLMAMRYIVSMI